jgi:hypothetical protein
MIQQQKQPPTETTTTTSRNHYYYWCSALNGGSALVGSLLWMTALNVFAIPSWITFLMRMSSKLSKGLSTRGLFSNVSIRRRIHHTYFEVRNEGWLDGLSMGSVDGLSDGPVDRSTYDSLDGSTDGSLDGVTKNSLDGLIDGPLDGVTKGSLDGVDEGSLGSRCRHRRLTGSNRRSLTWVDEVTEGSLDEAMFTIAAHFS